MHRMTSEHPRRPRDGVRDGDDLGSSYERLLGESRRDDRADVDEVGGSWLRLSCQPGLCRLEEGWAMLGRTVKGQRGDDEDDGNALEEMGEVGWVGWESLGCWVCATADGC